MKRLAARPDKHTQQGCWPRKGRAQQGRQGARRKAQGGRGHLSDWSSKARRACLVLAELLEAGVPPLLPDLALSASPMREACA